LRQLAQPIAQIVSPVTPTGARGSRYKTGRLTSQKSVQESLQLSIYALSCRDALGLGTPEKVTLYFTESATRMSTNRTDEQLDQAEEELLAWVTRVRSGDFAATPAPASAGPAIMPRCARAE
jgi:hypothetical protein